MFQYIIVKHTIIYLCRHNIMLKKISFLIFILMDGNKIVEKKVDNIVNVNNNCDVIKNKRI